MKKLITILIAILIFASCKKDNNNLSDSCLKNAKMYSNEYNTNLNLTNQYWYLLKNDKGGGFINLSIAGSTNGDSLTIRTYGDGDIVDEKLNLNSEKEFDENITISFTAVTLPEGEITQNTVITVYNKKDI